MIILAVTEWRARFAVSPHSHCNGQKAMKDQVPNCVDFMVEPPRRFGYGNWKFQMGFYYCFLFYGALSFLTEGRDSSVVLSSNPQRREMLEGLTVT